MTNSRANILSLLGGPLAALALGVSLSAAGQPNELTITAAITLWVAVWWVFETLPIPVTSLLPIALFPALGVMTAAQVGAAVGSPLILLLMGGFILSKGLQKSGVHRRLALAMLRLFGGTTRGMICGFLCTAAALSMWISNTATALMLLPIALAALGDDSHKSVRVAVILAVAYGCSIGSLGTPIGTPPNLLFVDAYREATGRELSFAQFMRLGLPAVALLVPLAALILTRGTPNQPLTQREPAGPWRQAEVRTLIVFALTAALWMTRREPFGGWSGWLDLPGATDATVALLAVVVMFLLPDGQKRGDRLLDWDTARDIPWGMLLLFGSGLCIARAFMNSGLSEIIGTALAAPIASLPLPLTLLLIAMGVTFFTEVVSNTATAALLMPILASAATAAGVDPLVVMLPAAMSASCAFMLPVATGPNAVAFGSGQVTIADMARRGAALNLLGAVAISAQAALYFG